jgi:signal transduction histidine kinase
MPLPPTEPQPAPRHRLRQRIAGVQLAAILAAVVLVALGIAALSATLIPRLAAIEDRVWAARLAPWLEAHYLAHGGWSGAQALLARLGAALPPGLLDDLDPPLPWQPDAREKLAGERYVLLDPRGLVLAAAGPGAPAPGRTLGAAEVADRGVPLKPAGALAGYLIASSGLMGEPALDAFRLILWKVLGATGLLAALLAAGASLVLARRIARPMEDLAAAARALQAGRPHRPLAPSGRDEVAETARAFDSMAEELGRQRRLREQMVADVAHELRTPVTVMRLELSAAGDGMQDPAAACATLAGELDTLERLIEDLRLLSLADAGGLRVQPQPLGLAAVLGEAALRWPAPGTGAVPSVRAAPGLRVLADPGRLRQVLDILLDNARRHAGPEARIELAAESVPGGVELRVADDGPGIPPGQLAAVFERFHRVDGSRSREGGGSGLGLAIAARLVELQGGRIRAESDGQNGTAILVLLPGA